jgi:predicted glutamine amidotransferase
MQRRITGRWMGGVDPRSSRLGGTGCHVSLDGLFGRGRSPRTLPLQAHPQPDRPEHELAIGRNSHQRRRRRLVGSREIPGLFRSIRPAWNDFNLRDLAAQIDTRLFLAHVRATSLATVQETNCHPFRWKNWLFVHNGEPFDVEKVRRELLMAVAPEYFGNILGTTDSELMFHLALTFGLEEDPPRALARMAGFVEASALEKGIAEALWMTLGVSDGRKIWAVRYASDAQAPSLYHSRNMEDVYKINPDLGNLVGRSSRVIVSEPLGTFSQVWLEVPQSSLLVVDGEDLEVRPFAPET